MAVALLVSYNEYKIKNIIHVKHTREINNRINTRSFFATASVMLNYGNEKSKREKIRKKEKQFSSTVIDLRIAQMNLTKTINLLLKTVKILSIFPVEKNCTE